jgi:hypothetical protein
MPGHMVVGVVDFMAAGVSTAGAVDFTAADFTRWLGSMAVGLADSTEVDSTGTDSTMAGSTTVDFTITGFSSVDCLDFLDGGITRIMGITITINPTPRRLGTTVPIPPVTTLM